MMCVECDSLLLDWFSHLRKRRAGGEGVVHVVVQ